ncbi:MAG: UDP-N-acetylglucosamine 2-epimerase (non-hydrolyzing) [Flavobacteriales bacterium]|nr:UDP-N-acetylglucosamine 2-epimerase (non-hydrolyzing) [Flavobacteriales bacterium]MCB9166053.1 UDP-N-acetylglucosamine 2-epimerase (non-hydrolyzing) [Flavobacteriales bacterium]
MAAPLRILTIVGARPQIIKASAISRAIRGPFQGRVTERLLHTGQHYDANMSDVFFAELGVPVPHIHLGVGSGSHADQTARMLQGIGSAILDERPDVVLVYGDTNSTLAGALAAVKVHVPVAHVEAGLRSFDKGMPEEINRLLTDHGSTWLFCPTRTAVDNLKREGFAGGIPSRPTADHPAVVLSGDVMFDNSLHFAALARERSTFIPRLGLKPGRFFLATIHRDHNTDDPERLSAILSALTAVAQDAGDPVVLPLHPRTRKQIERPEMAPVRKSMAGSVRLIEPVGFLDMAALEEGSRLVFTDSGGVQKESYFHRRPCVVLRGATEWVELVQHGQAILADADPERIRKAAADLLAKERIDTPSLFGDGHAAERICAELLGQA